MTQNKLCLLCENLEKPFDFSSRPDIMILGAITDVKERWLGVVKKTDQVREFVKQGNYKKALSITKGFRLGITREQNNKMVIAYECMTNERFYASLGFNIQERIQEGIDVLVGLYGGAKP